MWFGLERHTISKAHRPMSEAASGSHARKEEGNIAQSVACIVILLAITIIKSECYTKFNARAN